MKVEQKTKRFIEKHQMFTVGAGVLVALSGGADSVALLRVLCSLRDGMGLRLAALHVHHGIREEAQRDACFCSKLCEECQVEFYCEYADVPAIAEEQGLSVEEAGRKVRYALFEQYKEKLKLDVIAVAHHQNDTAETMLFQLFRGSGLKGLAGIPIRRGDIIRPLMGVTRNEIEEYLQSIGQSYVTDETNLSDAYTRNKIRHHILPLAEEVSTGAIEHMVSAAGQLREIADYLDAQATEFIREHGSFQDTGEDAYPQRKELCLSVPAICKAHPALQKAVIMKAIEVILNGRKDITEKHVEAILGLLEKEGEKSIDLTGDSVVIKCYERLIFKWAETVEEKEAFREIKIEPNQTYFLPDGSILETKLIFLNNLENIPKNDCTKWFDYDKIIGTLILRGREKGDYLTIRDDGARKSLQDYLVNEKVPRAMRDNLLVLADGHHIVWVLGKRISAYYKVTAQTQRILQIYIGGKEHG